HDLDKKAIHEHEELAHLRPMPSFKILAFHISEVLAALVVVLFASATRPWGLPCLAGAVTLSALILHFRAFQSLDGNWIVTDDAGKGSQVCIASGHLFLAGNDFALELKPDVMSAIVQTNSGSFSASLGDASDLMIWSAGSYQIGADAYFLWAEERFCRQETALLHEAGWSGLGRGAGLARCLVSFFIYVPFHLVLNVTTFLSPSLLRQLALLRSATFLVAGMAVVYQAHFSPDFANEIVTPHNIALCSLSAVGCKSGRTLATERQGPGTLRALFHCPVAEERSRPHAEEGIWLMHLAIAHSQIQMRMQECIEENLSLGLKDLARRMIMEHEAATQMQMRIVTNSESCDDDADAARARASDGGASGDGEDHAYHIEFRYFSFMEVYQEVQLPGTRSSAISESKKPAWMSPQEAKVAPASAEATKWRPYENCRNGCPLLSLMPPVVDPVTELWWAARWRAAWPLHRRVPGTCWTFGEAMFLPIICCAAVVFGARMWGDVERSGYPATFLGALTYATACRNSILTLLTGVPFERAIFYHKCIAVLAILAACYHGYVALSFPVDVSHAAIGTEQFTWSVLGEGRNWSGIAIFACWVSATLVALVWIRRYLVEIFNRLHIVAAMVGLVFAAQHGATTTLAGGALWALDKVLSLLFSLAKMNKAQTHKAMARVLPADLVEISFPRGSFKYKGGQWCNVWVPNLGLQWHPFSLSSSPHDPEVTFHIRALGGWTKSLVRSLKEVEAGSPVSLPIYVDGPFGSVGLDIDGPTYKSFLLVGGGIGVTPLRSIWGELLDQAARGRAFGKLRLLWSVSDSAMLEGLGVPGPKGETDAQVEIFLTREEVLQGERRAAIGDVMQQVVLGSRPDLNKSFDEMRQHCEKASEKRVAVLACGPTSLIKATQQACLKHSHGGIRFDLHSETFEF
ncbi:noxA, partial [Symbiodinium sp. KB8]